MLLKESEIAAKVEHLIQPRLQEQDRDEQIAKDRRQVLHKMIQIHAFALRATRADPLRLLAMSCSISSGSFGTFAVRFTLPSSVTNTSSSIRIPMPRYFAGADLSSGG